MNGSKLIDSIIMNNTDQDQNHTYQNNNIFADIANTPVINNTTMIPNDAASLELYKRQIELDYKEKLLDLQRQRDIFEQDQNNAKIEIQQRELILKQDQLLLKQEQGEVKAEYTKLDAERAKLGADYSKLDAERAEVNVERAEVKAERAQLHVQQLELDQNIKQYEAKTRVLEQEYSNCVNIVRNLGSARPSVDDSCLVRLCHDDHDECNDGDLSDSTVINNENQLILNKDQSIALSEYVGNVYNDLERREERLKAQLQLLKRGRKQVLADIEALHVHKRELEREYKAKNTQHEREYEERLTALEERERMVGEKADCLSGFGYEKKVKIPVRNDLKANYDAWEAIDDKYKKDKADADEKNKGKPQSEHVKVIEPKARICYKFVNVDKQLIVSNGLSQMSTPLCDIFHDNNHGFVGLWEHFFKRDYDNGIFPPKNDKLKLFVQSPHVLNNEWIQIYGPRTSLPDDVVLSNMTMCDPNKKNLSWGVSHDDRCILSKDECEKQHKPTDHNNGFFHSNRQKEYPYDFVINVKWEIIDE